MIETLALPVRIQLDPAPERAAHGPWRGEAEAAWRVRCAAHPGLFNGEIFLVTSIHEGVISGFFEEYLIWAHRAALLAHGVQLTALGVSGLTRCRDGSTVLARRGAGMLDLPGVWELTPAGGLDRDALVDGAIEPERVLRKELAEELNLEATAIRRLERHMLVLDHRSRVLDLVIRVDLDLDRSGVVERFATRATDEAQDLAFVTAEEPGPLGCEGDRVDRLVRHVLSGWQR
ncbi:MAG: NUDIX domain-containing protein [Myxococcales bacterium]|nr:NUDIX domain-containing protein [Myxococcales bacterium]